MEFTSFLSGKFDNITTASLETVNRASIRIINCKSALLKFGFFEKATKFEKIFVLHLTRASCSVRATEYLSKS